MVKQAVRVLNYKGAKITEENIKDTLGPKWAWKMDKVFQSVWFVEDDWQELGTREEIAEHNFKVQTRWLSGGGDPPPGNSGGMRRKSHSITCAHPYSGKGQWRNCSWPRSVRLQLVAVSKNWPSGASRKRKSIGCSERCSKN
jgi:hypothetical protein